MKKNNKKISYNLRADNGADITSKRCQDNKRRK